MLITYLDFKNFTKIFKRIFIYFSQNFPQKQEAQQIMGLLRALSKSDFPINKKMLKYDFLQVYQL